VPPVGPQTGWGGDERAAAAPALNTLPRPAPSATRAALTLGGVEEQPEAPHDDLV
jgi:hypothetical protein